MPLPAEQEVQRLAGDLFRAKEPLCGLVPRHYDAVEGNYRAANKNVNR
jgi:hypothetical protein